MTLQKIAYTSLLVVCFFGLSSQTILAADSANGQALHDAHCQSCHASLNEGKPSQIYTRADRRVTSLSGLKSQVNRCKASVGVAWFDDEVADVVEYLNSNFYKLK